MTLLFGGGLQVYNAYCAGPGGVGVASRFRKPFRGGRCPDLVECNQGIAQGCPDLDGIKPEIIYH